MVASQYLLNVYPSGSFAKGTAIRSGTDIDLFLSLAENTPATLRGLHESLFNAVKAAGYQPRYQNVSINIRVNGFSVDLVPGKCQDAETGDHSLYLRKTDSWIKTNVLEHIAFVRKVNRMNETRLLKLWRNQRGLEIASFYLELVVARALAGANSNYLSHNLQTVFEYVQDKFVNARYVDPANSNNVLSDTLTLTEKRAVVAAARKAYLSGDWKTIVT